MLSKVHTSEKVIGVLGPGFNISLNDAMETHRCSKVLYPKFPDLNILEIGKFRCHVTICQDS